MNILTVVLAVAIVIAFFIVESMASDIVKKKRNFGAKLVAPGFALSATGTVGKAFTYCAIRGIQYMREWFSPYNPNSTKQVNLRLAFAIGVGEWQDTLTQAQIDAYNDGAKGTKNTGFSLYQGRSQDAFISQVGVDTTPTGQTVAGNYPSDVFTWTP